MKTEEINSLAADPTEDNIGKLFYGLRPIVMHIAKQYSRCRADTDEMVGDLGLVLLNCIEAHRSDGGAGFRTYFIRSIHHRFSKFYRRNRPTPMEDIEAVTEDASPSMESLFDFAIEDGSITGQLASEAAAFASTLPKEQHGMLLDVLNGSSLAAIADGLGITKESARLKLRRAVESIIIQMQIDAPRLLKHIPERLSKRFSGGDKPLFE